MSSNITRRNLEQAATMKDDNWSMRVMVVGGVLGALLGLTTSYLLVRTSREVHGGPPAITTGDAMKVGITAIGLMRAIAALGDRR
jgi:hypothetical protein